jgi:hypothetical protein
MIYNTHVALKKKEEKLDVQIEKKTYQVQSRIDR